ncbi:transposase [Roseibium sp. MMSF_3412]|uniref:transposase n=1 Tax=Roseibium sp. MMSF_3412 TaxID=3046712 RepID=UPI00273E7A0D|nr:transposase [Roseibium sp. MMSF_3412]
MKRRRFSEEQTIAVLKKSKTSAQMDDLCQRHEPNRVCRRLVGLSYAAAAV